MKSMSDIARHYRERSVLSSGHDVKRDTEIIQDTVVVSDIPRGKLTYVIIYHPVTKRYGLSLLESALVSTIHTLSKNYGYCDMGQRAFASNFGVTTMTIGSTLNRLTEMGLVIKSVNKSQYQTNKLRVSQEAQEFIEEIRVQIELQKNTPRR